MSTTNTNELVPPSPAVLKPIRTDSIPSRASYHREDLQPKDPTKRSTAIIFATVTGVTGTSSLLNGLVAVTFPVMANDLNISDGLILW